MVPAIIVDPNWIEIKVIASALTLLLLDMAAICSTIASILFITVTGSAFNTRLNPT